MGGSLLLAVHCKRGDPVGLKDAVIHYVANTYGQRSAEDCSDDLTEVETLRAQIINQPKATPTLRASLIKYYSIISAMESRFPISNASDHVNVKFEWYDAFHPTKSCEQANIHFEKAAIAFNIAATISQYALESDRRIEAGLNNAIKLFQEAAGAFAHLRDHVALKVDVPRPIDLSPECAAMLEKLMLAQAQECVLEKAITGNKQPATLARLAKQVAVFYDETSRLLSSKPLSDHFDRSWQAHGAAKSLLFHLEADLQNAAHLRSEDYLRGVANEIAQLKAAKTSLEAAKKEAKSASKELQDNVAEKEKYVTERLAVAEKENAMVYLQRVPAAAELPGVVPACLVKSLPLTDFGSTSTSEKMFKGVVPETTTRALSKYTDMVDSLIRKQTDALATASDDARIKLREWELPESLAALEPHGSVAALPDALRLDLEKVEESGGLPNLHDLQEQIRNLRTVAESELIEAENELIAEATEDESLRAHYGPRWTRPPSTQLTSHLTERIKGYRGNLTAAAESDAKLDIRLAAEAAAFGALDPAAASAGLPRLQAPMLSVDNMEPAAAVFCCTGDGDLESFFKTELAKYDDLIKGVEENVKKQRQLLEAMAAANSTFRETYNFADWKRECGTASQGVRSTVRTFHEISGNLTEGVRFYTSLQDAVAAVKVQVGDYCMQRKIQRDEKLLQLKNAAAAQESAAQQQFAAMSLQHQQQQQQQQQQGGYGGVVAPPPFPPQPQQQQQWPAHFLGGPPPGGPPPPPPPPQQQNGALQQQGYGQYPGHVPPPPPGYGSGPPQQQPPPQPPQQGNNNPLSNFFRF
ncbi:hypothetical protein Ndes2437B_g02974 [Nannochloris sp. 'desiccata']